MSATDLNNTNINSSKTSKFNFFKKILNKILLFLRSLNERFSKWVEKKERKILVKKLMDEADTYDDWKRYAIEFDLLNDNDKWKSTKESFLYDWKEVEKLIKILQKKREIKDVIGLAHYIRVNLMKDLYSTSNPNLYTVSYYGTKDLIIEFQNEMIKSLDFIANYNEKNFPLTKKLEFFAETRHSYGRTALLLSGGASLGMFHIGIIKTLYELNTLPRIVCGSSAGSIVASMLCTNYYDDIPKALEKGLQKNPFEFKYKRYSFFRRLWRFLNQGVLFDVEVLKNFCRENVGDVTFQEAYDKTGWILNITVTGYKEHENHRLLNYLTAPNVLIWSATAASCCVPMLYAPVELLCKNEYGHIVPYSSSKFIDGSISFDLPMQRISELFNVNVFIVSQTNPHVLPFLNLEEDKMFFNPEKKKFNFWGTFKKLIASEIKHRCEQVKLKFIILLLFS